MSTVEKLVAGYAATAQNRAMAALVDQRIEQLRNQLESSAPADTPALQGAAQALRSLHRVLLGTPY